jgi:hypothetical protein
MFANHTMDCVAEKELMQRLLAPLASSNPPMSVLHCSAAMNLINKQLARSTCFSTQQGNGDKSVEPMILSIIIQCIIRRQWSTTAM